MRDNSQNIKNWYNKHKKKKYNIDHIEGEVWVPIIGYERLYHISNMGRIKKLASIIERKGGSAMNMQEKILKPSKGKNDYRYRTLSIGGVHTQFLVHRLVGLHFIPNIENKPEVNHLFGKEDNRASSLEWTTKKENMDHSVKNGLHRHGEGHPRNKLKKDQVNDIINSILSERKLAVIYNVSRSTINCIKSGRSWKDKNKQTI